MGDLFDRYHYLKFLILEAEFEATKPDVIIILIFTNSYFEQASKFFLDFY